MGEYTLTCGEGVSTPSNPHQVTATMLTTTHKVYDTPVNIAIQKALYIYDGSKGSAEANECKEITGGWVGRQDAQGQTIVKGDSYLTINTTDWAEILTVNKFDMSKYSKAFFDMGFTTYTSYSALDVGISTNTTHNNLNPAIRKNASIVRQILEVGIEDTSNENYVGVMISGSGSAKVYAIWLE